MKLDIQDLYAQRSGSKREMRNLRHQIDKIKKILDALYKPYLYHYKRFIEADEAIAKQERITYCPRSASGRKVPKVTSLIEAFSAMPKEQREEWLRRLKEVEEEENWPEEEKEEEDES